MQVIHFPGDIQHFSQKSAGAEKSIGLVPTMGALHEGHLSLVKQSVKDNHSTIVSIFVNPLQFNDAEDLENYPRTLGTDLALLEKQGVDAVYIPTEESMYDPLPKVKIDFGEMAQKLEGQFRPGHFSGVGIVVAKLLHHCGPHRAYFGLKDLQQYLLIRKMVEDLSFPVNIIGLPIIREQSGLAMSSRNRRLSEQGQMVAATIYEGLQLANSRWVNKSTRERTISDVIDFYNKQEDLEIEYFEIVDPETLEDVRESNNQPVVFCVAGHVEGVRLIDNLYLQ